RLVATSTWCAATHKTTVPVVRIRRRDQPAAVLRRERGEPSQRKMRHSGIDDDRIGWLLGAKAETVRRDYARLRPGTPKIFCRSDGQDGIDLDRRDPSHVTDDRRQDGARVAGIGSDGHGR